jgi:hypothetical protein
MKREARRLLGRFLPVSQPVIGSPVDDKITKVDRQTLERRLVVALSNLIVDDWRLLTTWAPSAGAGAERAIASALGWHIKAVMEQSWDVDCEYNRSSAAEQAVVKRWLASSDYGATDGPPPQPVTPDLIVHRRGLRGKANNLLVLELKKNDDGDDSPTGLRSRGSLRSILDIQKHFGYQHAVLLNLRLTPPGPTPQWTWVEFADRTKVAHEPDDVYEAASLRAMYRRGRLEEKRRYADI